MSPIVTEGLLIAILTLMGAVLTQLLIRVGNLEKKLENEQSRVKILWGAFRKLVDMYYRFRKPDAPDPPELHEIFEDD